MSVTERVAEDLNDLTFRASALSTDCLNSIADLEVLDDKVLVLDSLLQCLIVQDVPLILIRQVILHAYSSGAVTVATFLVHLENLDFFESWVNSGNLQPVDWQ